MPDVMMHIVTVQLLKKSSLPSSRGIGNTSSVYEAYTRYNGSLKRFIARFIRNSSDVDDIAQEACLRAFNSVRNG